MSWGDYNPPKTLVISKNPFDDLDEEKALEQSKKLFLSKLPTKAFITHKEKSSQLEVNPWISIFFIALGDQGSGKSVTIDNLAEWFREYYQGRKKRYDSHIWSSVTARKIDYLYNKIPKDVKYIFIGVEDATGLISNSEDLDLFDSNRRRWICQERTGNKVGVLCQVLGLHDWFAVNKLIRGSSNLVISKSSKIRLNQHDWNHQLMFMTKPGVELTQKCAKYREIVTNQPTEQKVTEALVKYGKYFGFGTCWNKVTENVTLWYNPLPSKNLDKIYNFQYQRQGEEIIEREELYEIADYKWDQGDYFNWEDNTLAEILKSKKYNKYAKFFKAKHIDLLHYNDQRTWDILGVKKSQTHDYYRNLDNGQTSIGGFISQVRGQLFEQKLLALCEDLGIKAKANPTITFEGYEYQDDIQLFDNIIINAKCGRGERQYTREKKLSESGEKVKGHYKSTYVFAQKGFEAYILYYDISTDFVTIIDTDSILSLDKLNVGGNRKNFRQLPLTQALEKISRITLSSPSLPDHPLPETLLQEKTATDQPSDNSPKEGGVRQ